MTVVDLRANIDPSYSRLLTGHERGKLTETFQARRPSVEERLAAGKALREKVPRSAHATYDKRAERADPIDILEKQNAGRIQKLDKARRAGRITVAAGSLV